MLWADSSIGCYVSCSFRCRIEEDIAGQPGVVKSGSAPPATKRRTISGLDAEKAVLRDHAAPLTIRQRRRTIIFSWVMSCMV